MYVFVGVVYIFVFVWFGFVDFVDVGSCFVDSLFVDFVDGEFGGVFDCECDVGGWVD